ncbi:MAG TPA: hypothetical protein PLU02_03640 [Chitinophagales bacterium]|nr:hypothetical protein [Chitinophagales bacterium]
MYKSSTTQIIALATTIMLLTACGNKKTTSPEVPENTDTLVQTTTTQPEVTDNTTETPPANTIAEKTETPVVKADVSGKGTIVQKGDIWVIRTTGSEGTDYLPSNLTKAFQVDGKAVTFEANLDEIPPGVRMAGRPVTLVSIK